MFFDFMVARDRLTGADSLGAPSSVLHMSFQVAIVVLMWADHDQLQIRDDPSKSQKILRGPALEFVHEYSFQVPFLFLSDLRVFCDSPYFAIQGLFFRFWQPSHSLLKRPGLIYLHAGLSKCVFGFLALFQFLQPNEDLLDERISQIRILFRALTHESPMFNLAGQRPMVYSAELLRLTD